MKRTTLKKPKSLRSDVLCYAAKEYGTQPEHLWLSLPDYAVLRHGNNRKWYALFMDVPRKKLGPPGEGIADVLEVKCDPILAGSLRMTPASRLPITCTGRIGSPSCWTALWNAGRLFFCWIRASC